MSFDRIAEVARAAGGKDITRIIAIAKIAVFRGDDIDATIASIKRNCPDAFYPREKRDEKKVARRPPRY